MHREGEGLTIKIRYESEDIERLKNVDDNKSDWIDLRAAEDVKMKAGEYRSISLGVAMGLPKGYEALILPRNSIFADFRIFQADDIRIIDESYCGNDDVWHFPAFAVQDTEIHKNDRICRFRIQKRQPRIDFEEVDRLGNDDRGGIGSTGAR